MDPFSPADSRCPPEVSLSALMVGPRSFPSDIFYLWILSGKPGFDSIRRSIVNDKEFDLLFRVSLGSKRFNASPNTGAIIVNRDRDGNLGQFHKPVPNDRAWWPGEASPRGRKQHFRFCLRPSAQGPGDRKTVQSNEVDHFLRRTSAIEGASVLFERKLVISARRPKKIVWTPIIINKTPKIRSGLCPIHLP